MIFFQIFEKKQDLIYIFFNLPPFQFKFNAICISSFGPTAILKPVHTGLVHDRTAHLEMEWYLILFFESFLSKFTDPSLLPSPPTCRQISNFNPVYHNRNEAPSFTFFENFVNNWNWKVKYQDKLRFLRIVFVANAANYFASTL